jgi:hypothetical protein
MNEPTELEKLNAVAQAEASKRNHPHQLRLYALVSVAVVGFAASRGTSPVENAVVRIAAILIIAYTVSVFASWRYAPALEQLLWALGYGTWASFSLPWFNRGFLAVAVLAWIVYEAIRAVRAIRAIRLANSPACLAEFETIGRWISQLTSANEPLGIIRFVADDFWSDGRVVVKLLQQDNWLVLASLLKVDPTKMLTLSIFDTRSTSVAYSREQNRLRIGDRKFRKVEFSPALTALANQFAQRNAAV